MNIREFQRTHCNHLGQPLDVDDDIGPETQWALDVEALGARGRIVLAALDHVGLEEAPPGSNRGPDIDAWLLRCGVPVGLAWCAAFASHCVSFGGTNVHEASVARLAQKLPQVMTPLAGDVFYWLNPDGTGHCGIVTGVAASVILTCEGNSEDGVRVWRRERAGLKFLSTVAEPKQPGVPSGAVLKSRAGKTR
jgi:hypothetical protein